ncbi:GNAT family N-acetyltransferase [Staphylococcus delphini]|uniref:GNAT family N-acetyltransferase n=1 Tax=Staphylococcus delphini TaxID=53344 RepID=UPI0021D0D618|nr:GNAT family protein [Staphylococcus delphini]UXS21432.1 GNAT family N-acetyltransferase [Staphylococcus delphini]UXS57382.1 GNAT family N-acetyltransferase [Staphylococcus delphini]
MQHFRLAVNDDIDFIYPTMAYAPALYKVVDQNRDHLKTFLPWAETISSVEDEKTFMLQTLNLVAEGKALFFLIYKEDQLIGTIDLHAWNEKTRKAEVGYWLAKSENGQGITTAAVRKLCDIAFTDYDLNKLELRANVLNIGSNRVAEKVGFRFVGVKHEDVIDGGQYMSMNYYECLKRDFYRK